MRRADLALDEAKTTGRNRTCIADSPMPEALAHASGHPVDEVADPRRH
jgi:hypothetical protein